MKVFEIFSTTNYTVNKEPDFDLADDLMFFMRNDPEYYKREFFPLSSKIKMALKKGQALTPSIFKNAVKSAYSKYRTQFSLDNLPSSLEIDTLSEICKKLYSEETEFYKKSNRQKK